MMKIQKNRSSTILVLLLLTILIKGSLQEDCMIDKCKECDFKNVYTCNECEGGHYLVSFFGTEKNKVYHACWQT